MKANEKEAQSANNPSDAELLKPVVSDLIPKLEELGFTPAEDNQDDCVSYFLLYGEAERAELPRPSIRLSVIVRNNKVIFTIFTFNPGGEREVLTDATPDKMLIAAKEMLTLKGVLNETDDNRSVLNQALES